MRLVRWEKVLAAPRKTFGIRQILYRIVYRPKSDVTACLIFSSSFQLQGNIMSS